MRYAWLWMCHRLPVVIREGIEQSGPLVLGSLSEKDPSCHGEMWGMCLFYCKALPEVWQSVDAKKAFLPRLFSLLRRGFLCFLLAFKLMAVPSSIYSY